jgi:hypothetical protein
VVEHFLGKEEVVSSILINGSDWKLELRMEEGVPGQRSGTGILKYRLVKSPMH